MSRPELQIEMRNSENKSIRTYSMLFKIFIIITLLLIILLAVVLFGVFVLGYGHNWALISVDGWIIAVSLLAVVFILLEFLLYFNLSSLRKKRIELEKPKPEYIEGKRVYIFTHPAGVEGGIFSKTYIELDKNSILRLRSLIIPPEELW
jgi:hypothetical protein